MANVMKVVCPKCQAKLKLDPAKITSDVTKFKCPGCAVILSIKKPTTNQNKTTPFIRREKKLAGPGSRQEASAEESGPVRGCEQNTGSDVQAQDNITDAADRQEATAKTKEQPAPGEQDIIEDETSKTSDTRQDKRVKYKKKVLVNNQIMVEALDISENGLFLHTGRSFDDGSIVEVGIPTQPGNFDLVVQAEVRHNHRGIGMGLQFVDVDDEQKVRLRKLISEQEKAVAEETEGRKKILLAGGSDIARNINKSKLVLDGFYVLQATTADEVFKTLEEEPPDAIVLEWQETKFNCKGLLARIKQNPDYDAIIKVVLSALTDSQIQRAILDCGAHKYMAKMDTNPAKLSLVLKQLIEERDGSE